MQKLAAPAAWLIVISIKQTFTGFFEVDKLQSTQCTGLLLLSSFFFNSTDFYAIQNGENLKTKLKGEVKTFLKLIP